MAASTTIPDPDNISVALFNHLLSLYPAVLQLFYKSKLKDAKKLSLALVDDDWRYERFPSELKERCKESGHDSKSKGELEKDELLRLVQWKM
jgi:hypothetical protein